MNYIKASLLICVALFSGGALLLRGAADLSGMPGGAIGIWYMDQYVSSPTPTVANSADVDGPILFPGTLPTFGSNVLDFSNSSYGSIHFGTLSTTTSAITAIGLVSKAVAGGSTDQSYLSKQGSSYTDFTAYMENDYGDGPLPNFWFNNTEFVTIGTLTTSPGWHMLTGVQTGTETDWWTDDVKLVLKSQSVSAISAPDLFVSSTNGVKSNYKIASIALYTRALSDTEIRRAYAALTSRLVAFGNTPATTSKIIASEGDSLSSGSGAYPLQYGTSGPLSTQLVDNSVAGSTLADVAARSPKDDAVIPPNKNGRKFILSVLVGTNDLNGSNTATFTANLATYLDNRHTAGFLNGCITILPKASGPGGSPDTTFNTARNTVNASIATWVGTHCDFIIDFAANATMGCDSCATNGTYYIDGIHPTAAGQAILEGIYATAMNAQ